jgi:DNA-binding PadR family transcriptional regulator
MKVTTALEKVLRILAADPQGKHWGYDLMQAAGLKSGTLYPMLSRLQDEGFVTSEWDADDRGGPRRKYYLLTETGERFCRVTLAAIDAEAARNEFVRLKPGIAAQ